MLLAPKGAFSPPSRSGKVHLLSCNESMRVARGTINFGKMSHRSFPLALSRQFIILKCCSRALLPPSNPSSLESRVHLRVTRSRVRARIYVLARTRPRERSVSMGTDLRVTRLLPQDPGPASPIMRTGRRVPMSDDKCGGRRLSSLATLLYAIALQVGTCRLVERLPGKERRKKTQMLFAGGFYFCAKSSRRV